MAALGPGDARFRVQARGYGEATVELGAGVDAGEVVVGRRPVGFAELIAEYSDGTPLVDARIEWTPAPAHSERDPSLNWIQSRRSSRGHNAHTRTDSTGRARLELAGPAFVTLLEPEHGTRSSLELRPGESRRIVLEVPVRLRVLDHASGAPLGDLGLDLGSPTDLHALADSVVTDAEGWALYRPRRYPLLVRRADAAMWQGELVCDDPNVTLLGPRLPQATLARIEARPASGEVTLRLRRSAGRVRIVDDDSGEPLAGPVRVSRPERDCGLIGRPTFCSLLGTRSSFGTSDGPYALHGGFLDLPILLRFEGESERPLPSYRDVAFLTEGYHPVWLSELPNVDLVEFEVVLVPRYVVPLPEGDTSESVPPYLALGWGSPRLVLDAHGRYRIEPGDPVPECIAVCVADPVEEWGSSGGLRVLDAILPGESAEIAVASLSLVWNGPAGERLVIVEYDVPTGAHRRVLRTARNRVSTRWRASTPLRLDAVPLGVRELRVQGRPIAVELRANTVTVLTIEPDRIGAVEPH